jgi:hypothetical protein
LGQILAANAVPGRSAQNPDNNVWTRLPADAKGDSVDEITLDSLVRPG